MAIPLMPLLAFIAAPLPAGLLDYRAISSVKLLDRDGQLLRELRSTTDGRSTPLKSEDLTPQVQAAFLAAEDHRFHGHVGISPTAILRAAKQNLKAGHLVAGGSTITQQLARTLVPRPRTFFGKAQEALWALRLEAHLSKDEILTQYLNRIPFGNNTFGLEAAAQLYFGKRARHLSLGQAAMLASIPRGPTAYDPYRRPRQLEARRAWVLQRLEVTGLATPDLVASAKAEPLDLTAFTAAFRAPHFVEYIAAHLSDWGLAKAAVVETSLDPRLQPEVEEQIAQEVGRLTERRVSSAASLVVDNATGEILAYAGSADFFNDAIFGQNDGIQMHRQPGSALKPFIYAEAFAHGYTPATVIPDLDTAFNAPKGSYSPKNYDRRLHGPVRAREALANSYNVPAVRVADDVGLGNALAVLRRAGFDSLKSGAEHYGLGLALGNGEVSLWEAARAYSGLSRGGVVHPLVPVLRAWDAEGNPLPVRRELKPRRFAESRAVALVTHILSDNAARARAFGIDNALRLPFPAAAKTGTSKGYSDNWTVGFTRERTVAVWAGNFDGTPMIQVSGITGAGPIFKRVMTKAMKDVVPQSLVDRRGLDAFAICPLSGHLAGASCPAAMEELFVPGTGPTSSCEMHGELSATLSPELRQQCLQLAASQGRLVDLGLDFYDWAKNEGLAREPWLAAACMGSAERDGSARVLHPVNGGEFLLLADLPLADQAIPVRVRAASSSGPLAIWVDGERALELAPPFTGHLPATQGAHVMEVRDRSGVLLDTVKFVVRR
ncbi:MAG: penicillin-binding protein 1C [Archangium sp.]|nr:penicillin-binding protein 1C [Archangium sp.]MDP3571982.1 penicillin-binding protein 1C [Archangium sp.]